jgi:hypothetical protein
MRSSTRIFASAAAGLFALALSGGGFAYFTAHAEDGGAGAAAATSVDAGPTPIVSLEGGTAVRIAWAETTLANGAPVDGYLVTRYDAVTGEPQETLTGCEAAVAGLECTETGVPDGTWEYGLTPLKGAHWHGAEGPRSGALTLGAAQLVLDQELFATLPASATGSLSGFGSNEGLSYRLDEDTELEGSPESASAAGSAAVAIGVPAGTSDGPHTLFVLGAATPEPSSASAPILIDTTAPTSEALGLDEGWRTSAVTVTLAGDDGPVGSGVDFIAYRLDGGPEQTIDGTSGDVLVTGDGTHTLEFHATDLAGHAEGANVVAIKIDGQAPTTAIATAPASPDGANGWFKQASVTFTLAATDATSGIAGRFYALDGSAAQTYTGPVAITSPGDHSLSYWSTDNAGNSETATTAHVKLDDTAPSTTDDTASIGSGWKATDQTVTLTRSDASSGVAATYYTTDGSTPTTGSPQGASVSLTSEGVHAIRYFSVDNAGNTESVRTASTQIRIDKTAPVVTGAVVANNSTNAPGLRRNVAYTVYANVAESGSGVAGVTANLSSLGNGTSVPLSACSSGCTLAGVTYAYKSAALTANTTVGTKAYTVTATDAAANSSGATPFTVVVDETNPIVGAKQIADALNDTPGFVRSGGGYRVYANVDDASPSSGIAGVTANVTNFTSGVTATPLSSSGGPWTIGGTTYAYRSGLLTVGAGVSAGNKSAQVTATDNAGNSGSTTNSNTAYVDNTAPATTATKSPLANTAGWNKATVTVSLTATDASAGVGSITFGATGAQPAGTTTVGGTSTSVLVTTEGTTTISYFATDSVGNVEATKTVVVSLDATSPTAGTFSLPSLIRTGQVLTNPGAADSLSGVESVRYYYCPGSCTPSPGTLIGAATTGPAYSFTWSSQPAGGSYSVVARVTDLAGNTSDSAVVTTTIDNTAPVPTDVTLANGAGSIAKQVDAGDTVTITYSEQLDATTFCSSWTNAGTQSLSDVTVAIANAGGTDTLTVSTGSCSFRLGSIVPGDYVNANTSFSSSTIVWEPGTRQLTITIGTFDSGTIRTNQSAAKPTYTPDAGLADLAGNSMSTSKFTAAVASWF